MKGFFKGWVLKKGQVKSSKNKWACMKTLMQVEKAKVVCQERSRPTSVERDGMYMCIYVKQIFCALYTFYINQLSILNLIYRAYYHEIKKDLHFILIVRL